MNEPKVQRPRMNATIKNFTYKTVLDDSLNVRIYTLPNGLKLYLSVNKSDARVFTNIVVRAGSKQDPPDTTGLAHYMEHMLFKGTSRIGAIDWEKESALLEQISDLYEQHRNTQDTAERKRLYAEIDRLSFEAAKMVAPNEYDKLATALGAKSTNAYTWVEQTVYVNDIPSNELDRWLRLESERFRMMALRLFHTELETVYEEFNISQDKDFRKANNAIRAALFPNHPYGTRTTLGTGEDLKSPSQKKIQQYFNTYYVPNNMAIILSGDFDPDEVVRLVNFYFGDYEYKEIPPFTFQEQPLIEAPIRREVYGQEAPSLDIAWRFETEQKEQQLFLVMLRCLLYNRQAGLLDIHLNQKQKVLSSEAWTWFYEDYSVFGLYGKPREGQSLQEVEHLLLQEIERIKAGDFEDWLPQAVVKDLKLGEIKSNESNKARVHAMTNTFILGMKWEDYVNKMKALEQIDKEQIMAFAKSYFQDNYVVVYKHQGEDTNVIKVEKPDITPVELQRDAVSEFASEFLTQKSSPLKPKFVDFSQIQKRQLKNGLELNYVHNADNELFRLDYIFEMGRNVDRKLAIAIAYLPYLGTSTYSAADLQKEFFKHGLHFNVYADDYRLYITLSGLEESLEDGIQLFEHILDHLVPDAAALEKVVSDILQRRQNAKQNKDVILREALASYARYGASSPFLHFLSEEELKALKPEELTQILGSLKSYEHRAYYYGQKTAETVAETLDRLHQVPAELKSVPKPKRFQQLDTAENQILFLDFPTVQTDVLLLSKGTPSFNLEQHLMKELYNEYFGYGLSSIIFQEIRESKALAYATYAVFTSPARQEQAHYLNAYVGTQPDKLKSAIPALLDNIEDMPVVPAQIEHARQSILKRIESERAANSKLYWEYISVQDRGQKEDLSKFLYETMQKCSIEDLVRFQKEFVKGRQFTFVILGDKSQIDMDYLQSLGKFRELSLEEIFGY